MFCTYRHSCVYIYYGSVRVLVVAVHLCMKLMDVNVTFWLWNRPLPTCCWQDVQPSASLLDGTLFIWPALDKRKYPNTAENQVSLCLCRKGACEQNWPLKVPYHVMLRESAVLTTVRINTSPNMYWSLSGSAQVLAYQLQCTRTWQNILFCPHLKISLFTWMTHWIPLFFMQFDCFSLWQWNI